MAGQSFSTNTGLSVSPEIDQSKNPDVYTDNLRIRNAIRIIQAALDVYTGMLGEDPSVWDQIDPLSWVRLQNLTRVYIKASENIAAGALVHFHDGGGFIAARNANATTGTRPARGYSPEAVLSGSYGQYYLSGIVGIAGLTLGTTYYLSDVNGVISNAAGTTPQVVGYALGTASLFFNPVMI